MLYIHVYIYIYIIIYVSSQPYVGMCPKLGTSTTVVPWARCCDEPVQDKARWLKWVSLEIGYTIIILYYGTIKVYHYRCISNHWYTIMYYYNNLIILYNYCILLYYYRCIRLYTILLLCYNSIAPIFRPRFFQPKKLGLSSSSPAESSRAMSRWEVRRELREHQPLT